MSPNKRLLFVFKSGRDCAAFPLYSEGHISLLAGDVLCVCVCVSSALSGCAVSCILRGPSNRDGVCIAFSMAVVHDAGDTLDLSHSVLHSIFIGVQVRQTCASSRYCDVYKYLEVLSISLPQNKPHNLTFCLIRDRIVFLSPLPLRLLQGDRSCREDHRRRQGHLGAQEVHQVGGGGLRQFGKPSPFSVLSGAHRKLLCGRMYLVWSECLSNADWRGAPGRLGTPPRTKKRSIFRFYKSQL